MSHSPATIAILGAGGRGAGFATQIENLPHLGQVAAVAVPRDACREKIAMEFALPAHRVFKNWQSFVA